MASDHQLAPVGVPIGEVIGGYRLIRLIGAGSTSHVYLGHHARLGRPAAIKVLHADLVNNAQVVHRMLTEARVVNDIGHPNIVDIFDFVDQRRPRRVALIMEYIPGPSVDSLQGVEPLPWQQSVGIARQLVEAVEAAHRAGVIHRDLKPDNLLLATDPRSSPATVPDLKVVDFGIAKVAGPATRHQTATQTMLGTPAYMAPEQIAQSPPPSGATDVFAVGEILYELLSGQRAYRSAKLADVVRQKLRGEIPDLPLAPMPGRAELQALIRRCLAFRPDERPKLADVLGLLNALPTLPSPPDHESVGAATVAPEAWQEDGARPPGNILSEATQLSDLAGIANQQTEAGWRPALEEETVGVGNPKPVAPPSPKGARHDRVTALEMTEPFSGEHVDALDFDSVGPPFDLHDRSILHADTAMSAEALAAADDGAADESESSPDRRTDPVEAVDRRVSVASRTDPVESVDADAVRAKGPSDTDFDRRPRSYEETPTREVLPSQDSDSLPMRTPRPRFQPSGIRPSETVVAPVFERSGSGADPLPLVPARDGGPPVASDDPLAKPRASTVIRPKPRSSDDEGDTDSPPGDSGPTAPPRGIDVRGIPSLPTPATHPSRGWQQTLDRAIQARNQPPRPTPSDALPTAPSPAPERRKEGNVATRVERTRPSVPLILLPLGLVLLVVVVVVAVRVGGPERPSVRRFSPSVEVKSQPPDAFVEDAVTGEFLCKTPCAVLVADDGTRQVKVFKAGFVARNVDLNGDVPSMWVPLVPE